jgi:iron-sulfur cluster repair protein YtfE (RIC family)
MAHTSTSREVLEKTKQEHDALREKLRRIHEALASVEIKSDVIVNLLLDFQSALQVHFANEESGGFFNEVTTHSPHFTYRTDTLYVEHGELLHNAMELCRFATAGNHTATWWRALSSQFHVFSKELMCHESEENKLLQQVYQDDIGTSD